jgi:hypothetical protein
MVLTNTTHADRHKAGRSLRRLALRLFRLAAQLQQADPYPYDP